MPNFDPLTYRYSSRRNVVYAKNGVCCTSVPLGAQVGLDVLKNGGNAVDAAVAMAGAMPLLERRLPFPRLCRHDALPRRDELRELLPR